MKFMKKTAVVTGATMENADLICFLASNEAGYISGQNIQIDGVRKKL